MNWEGTNSKLFPRKFCPTLAEGEMCGNRWRNDIYRWWSLSTDLGSCHLIFQKPWGWSSLMPCRPLNEAQPLVMNSAITAYLSPSQTLWHFIFPLNNHLVCFHFSLLLLSYVRHSVITGIVILFFISPRMQPLPPGKVAHCLFCCWFKPSIVSTPGTTQDRTRLILSNISVVLMFWYDNLFDWKMLWIIMRWGWHAACDLHAISRWWIW